MSSNDFKYLICLDFEATCWEGRNNDEAEVIEFGAVLLNLQNGVIESEFHEYVRPTHHPNLSDFCVSLTGITQNHINQQQPFPIVFGRFISWLSKIQNQRSLYFGCNVTFCSWSNVDLGHFLPLDCMRNGITRPESLKKWINVCTIYDSIFGRVKTPFSNALLKMKIIPTGMAHSAINDARNLAKMVKRLSELGGNFREASMENSVRL